MLVNCFQFLIFAAINKLYDYGKNINDYHVVSIHVWSDICLPCRPN